MYQYSIRYLFTIKKSVLFVAGALGSPPPQINILSSYATIHRSTWKISFKLLHKKKI